MLCELHVYLPSGARRKFGQSIGKSPVHSAIQPCGMPCCLGATVAGMEVIWPSHSSYCPESKSQADTICMRAVPTAIAKVTKTREASVGACDPWTDNPLKEPLLRHLASVTVQTSQSSKVQRQSRHAQHIYKYTIYLALAVKPATAWQMQCRSHTTCMTVPIATQVLRTQSNQTQRQTWALQQPGRCAMLITKSRSHLLRWPSTTALTRQVCCKTTPKPALTWRQP